MKYRKNIFQLDKMTIDIITAIFNKQYIKQILLIYT
jgi:hypothetical protein